MNYINKDKNYMTDTERIKYLEESIRELRKEKEYLNKERWRMKEENKKLNEKYDWLWKIYTEDVNDRIEENEKLKEENSRIRTRIKEHVPYQIQSDFIRKFEQQWKSQSKL